MNNTLTFEPLSIEHGKFLTCVWSDKNVIKYADIYTPCSTEQINNIINNLKSYDVFVVKNKLTVIGMMGCLPECDEEKNQFSIFYYFCRACWNHGYATDSIKWLICFMRRKYQPLTLYADNIAENVFSEKLLLKNNFKMVSEKPYQSESMCSNKRRYVLEEM